MSVMAEVRPFPGTKLVPVRRVDDLKQRKALLTWLARNMLDIPAEAVPVLRDAWAWDRGPAAEARWDEFCARLAIADAADAGCLDYRLVAPDLTCGERTEVAGEIARQDAEDALSLLAGGCSQ